MPALLPSELPVRARTRHHWIVLFRLPHKYAGIAFLVALVAAWIWPNPIAWALGLVVIGALFLRWRTWKAEWILLTNRRIIRVQGIPETTSTETSLRVDRVSGARLIETVPGKLLGYGTIDLEAPGQHPGVRHLERITHPHDFYLTLRDVIFGENTGPDPDERPGEYVTEPLPKVDPDEQTWRWGRPR